MSRRRVRRALALLAAAPLALAGGCTIVHDRAGDPAFLVADAPMKAGVTTAAEVASALGPPDGVFRRGRELWFTYRYRDIRSSSLVIAYYLKAFSRETINRIDATLVVAFDEDDRLLYHGIDERPPEEMLRFFW